MSKPTRKHVEIMHQSIEIIAEAVALYTSQHNINPRIQQSLQERYGFRLDRALCGNLVMIGRTIAEESRFNEIVDELQESGKVMQEHDIHTKAFLDSRVTLGEVAFMQSQITTEWMQADLASRGIDYRELGHNEYFDALQYPIAGPAEFTHVHARGMGDDPFKIEAIDFDHQIHPHYWKGEHLERRLSLLNFHRQRTLELVEKYNAE